MRLMDTTAQGTHEGNGLIFKLNLERRQWDGAQFVVSAISVGMTSDCPRIVASGPFVGENKVFRRMTPIVSRDGKTVSWRYKSSSKTFIIVNL